MQYFFLVHAHKPKILLFLRLQVPNFFSCLFPFLSFSALSLSVPFALHILSGCRKKLAVNYDQLWPKPRNGTRSITRIVSHFVAFFAPKRIALFFRMRSICKTDCCVDRSNQALLSAYQEWRRYLFTNIDVIFAHARKITCTCGWQKLFRPGQILYSQTNFQCDFRQVSILAFPLNLNSEALS